MSTKIKPKANDIEWRRSKVVEMRARGLSNGTIQVNSLLVFFPSTRKSLDSKQQPAPHELTSFAHLTDDKTIIYPEKLG